ncbi:MAG: branched-chain amino acid ABC transporter permease [Gammaproteobacteria bacterium]|jgi:branched-chain amino acid transport system permease protein|nr:branched-chain amino acid ABC transporter permease [Gammaproteobacteria bacterium]MBT4659415.1 branched-chain amino acid ABC transporter permease [Gammaproteobacteria bacterium]MBT5173836.1 branched-chain amino acid ABC transporter permease [Gammaproteobacteria bacterium]MBT5510861.1 branched-chain amino acid ABC transporter permease [Gammaproteobacteria bacterium]MBT5741889.1 branched-chain amino acid ABC transporter permease [Gammaproteobacteria bacterium]
MAMIKKLSVWIAFLLVMLALPQFSDSILSVSIYNQMAIAIIFALSYNMLLGQGGMLSFGHAVYFGLGGFLAVHTLIMMEFETVYFSIIWIPLVGGLFGLLAAIFIGSFSTHKAGTVFAMISLGIGELIAASSLIFVGFFGGEAGVSGDRTFGPPLFGVEFFQDVEIYYVAAVWVFIATVFMYLFTQTPAGRMANAVRDNPERAEFIGYSARRVRFISFCASGLFAGIAGGLFALNYEFITEENLNAATSGRVLLMAYIGGLGYFIGPILGAVILTLMNSLLSNYSDLWMLYLGIMFLLTVLFLPRGFAGFIMMHQVAWLKGSLKNLALPYLITCIPAILFLVGAIGMLEMSHSEDAIFHFLGMELDTSSTITWLAAIIFTLGSLFATSKSLPQLRDAWEEANTIPEVVKEDES